jgi:putative transposase
MGRTARIIVPEMPHHVTARGNRCEAVFHDDEDRQVYLDLVIRYSARLNVAISAYCLMDNHIHLVATPKEETSLCDMMRAVQMNYATYFNRRDHITGKLWGDRYYSCVLDDLHFLAAVRYVENNPVRAGMIDRAERYPWSSAAEHCGISTPPVLLPAPLPDVAAKDWAAWLQGECVEECETLRSCTRREIPAGDEDFITRLEARLGRRLRPNPRGRPPKEE